MLSEMLYTFYDPYLSPWLVQGCNTLSKFFLHPHIFLKTLFYFIFKITFGFFLGYTSHNSWKRFSIFFFWNKLFRIRFETYIFRITFLKCVLKRVLQNENELDESFDHFSYLIDKEKTLIRCRKKHRRERHSPWLKNLEKERVCLVRERLALWNTKNKFWFHSSTTFFPFLQAPPFITCSI